MDVVKTNIAKIGGTVDVQSESGAGTTVRMKIPRMLAIIPALIVTNGGERYAIPQISLVELVRLEGEDAKKRIEPIQGMPDYRLRGRLLPLVHLINDTEEIVVKPLGKQLKGIRTFAGSTIMGDGRVALILDVGFPRHPHLAATSVPLPRHVIPL